MNKREIIQGIYVGFEAWRTGGVSLVFQNKGAERFHRRARPTGTLGRIVEAIRTGGVSEVIEKRK